MSPYAPYARVILRYVVGAVVGAEIGDLLAGDPDLVLFVAMGISAAVETAYTLAKRRGWQL